MYVSAQHIGARTLMYAVSFSAQGKFVHRPRGCSDQGVTGAAAEAVGGAIAGLLAAPLYGVGAGWLKSMLPWHKRTEAPVGPNGILIDQAPSKRDRAHNYIHKPTDSAGSPDMERQPLETVV